MATVTISYRVEGEPGKKPPHEITVHADPTTLQAIAGLAAVTIAASTRVDDAIREGLDLGGFVSCYSCGDWYYEGTLVVLKEYSVGNWTDHQYCRDCHAQAIEPHARECRCDECKGAYEYAQENKMDAKRCGDG